MTDVGSCGDGAEDSNEVGTMPWTFEAVLEERQGLLASAFECVLVREHGGRMAGGA